MSEEKCVTNLQLRILKTVINYDPLNFLSKENDYQSQSVVGKVLVNKDYRETFDDNSKLDSHIEKHKKERKPRKKFKRKTISKCDYCSAILSSQIALSHKLLYHPVEHKCIDCNLKFQLKSQYDEHMSSLHTIKIHTNITNSIPTTDVDTIWYYKVINEVPSTEKVVGLPNLYQCEVCFRNYQYRHEYEEHLRIHEQITTEDKTKTKRKQPENLYTNVGIEIKKIPCEYCIAIYPCITQAIKHKHQSHPGYPNYNCRICGKIYPLKFSFDIHMNTVHNCM